MKKIKNPCPICGNKTDTQGWCGSSEHDAGNPFGGINCITGSVKDFNNSVEVVTTQIKSKNYKETKK